MSERSLRSAVIAALVLSAAAATQVVAMAPRTGCADIVDAKGDGGASVAVTSLPNDDDLDITAVAFRTTDATIEAHITVAKYNASGPALGAGHRFDFGFAANGKNFSFRSDGTTTVDGTANASVKVTSSADAPANRIVIAVDRASLNAAAGVTIADGAVVTSVAAHSAVLAPGGVALTADTAQASDASSARYEVGVSACFEGPRGTLRYVGRVAAQFSDRVRVAVQLKPSEDKDRAHRKRITFRLGSATAVATTDKSGYAETSLAVTVPAGTHTLSATFAGDSEIGRSSTSATFSVRIESTQMSLSGDASAGFTATVTDDDGAPVADEEVTWEVDGKEAGKSRTDKSGRAKFRGGKRGSKVDAKYKGNSGRYGSSSASRRG